MSKKKIFRVQAEVVSYCHIDIEANSAEEANSIAEGVDGGDFITDEGGEFNILNTLTDEVKEEK